MLTACCYLLASLLRLILICILVSFDLKCPQRYIIITYNIWLDRKKKIKIIKSRYIYYFNILQYYNTLRMFFNIILLRTALKFSWHRTIMVINLWVFPQWSPSNRISVILRKLTQFSCQMTCRSPHQSIVWQLWTPSRSSWTRWWCKIPGSLGSYTM